jgi:hypothetical protein
MWQTIWLASDLFLIGLELLGGGLIVYFLLFAELSRQRHQRPLTAELLTIYLSVWIWCGNDTGLLAARPTRSRSKRCHSHPPSTAAGNAPGSGALYSDRHHRSRGWSNRVLASSSNCPRAVGAPVCGAESLPLCQPSAPLNQGKQCRVLWLEKELTQ